MRLQDLADLAEAGDPRLEGGAQARDGRELLERRREFRPERRGGRGKPPVGEESLARLDVKDQRFEVGLDIGRVEPDAQRPQHVARPRPLPGDQRRERTQAGRRSDGGGDPQLFHRRPLAAFVALEFFIERAFGLRQQTNPVRPVRQEVFMARTVEPEKFIEVWRDRRGELHRIGHCRPDRDVRLGSRPECGHQGRNLLEAVEQGSLERRHLVGMGDDLERRLRDHPAGVRLLGEVADRDRIGLHDGVRAAVLDGETHPGEVRGHQDFARRERRNLGEQRVLGNGRKPARRLHPVEQLGGKPGQLDLELRRSRRHDLEQRAAPRHGHRV